MSQGLNKKERFDFLAQMLKKHCYAFNHMAEDQPHDYTELLYLFASNDDDIFQRGAVAPMIGIVDNAKKL